MFLLQLKPKLTICYLMKFSKKWDLFRSNKRARIVMKGLWFMKHINFWKNFKLMQKIYAYSCWLWLEYFTSIQSIFKKDNSRFQNKSSLLMRLKVESCKKILICSREIDFFHKIQENKLFLKVLLIPLNLRLTKPAKN